MAINRQDETIQKTRELSQSPSARSWKTLCLSPTLDIYDALTADDRPYKPDPELTRLFIESKCWEL